MIKRLLKQDEETKVRIDDEGVVIEELFETQFLNQIVTYVYDSGVLVEEKIIQIDKQSDKKKIMIASYNSQGCKTIFLDEENNETEVLDFITDKQPSVYMYEKLAS